VLFLVVAGCKSDMKNAKKQQVKKDIVADMAFASYTDSLEYIVKTGSEEAQLEALSNLTLYYQNNDVSKARYFAWQQKDLAKQYNNLKWLTDAYDVLGGIYFYEQQVDSTEFYYRLSLEIYSALNNPCQIAQSLVNMSSALRLKMQPDSAIVLLEKALVVFEAEEKDEDIAQVLINIASIYNDMGNYQKHDEYALKALAIQEPLGSSNALGITLINLCVNMAAQDRLNEAITYGDRAIMVFKDIDQPFFICASLIRTGEVLFEKGDNERAIKYMNEAILYADEIGSIQLKIETLRQRANYYLKTECYFKAKADAEDAFAMVDTLNISKTDLVCLYDLLTRVSIYTNEKEDILKYFKKYVDAKNVVQQEKWTEHISEMETKYFTEKKELKINILEKEKRFYSLITIASVLLLFFAVAIFFFLWRWTLQKKQLAEQQLKQIEQERQIIAAQAALDGENAERSRLAKDLHDGLGSMLSLVKITLPDMKSGGSIEAEDVKRFQQALSMLDNSINELRRIAHHMMPESLMRHGIKVSLSDFCCAIPNVEFYYFGNNQRLDSKLEILLYRITHELINNALKHAEATQINVQLVQEDDRVSLTVHDNGKGFDTTMKYTGIGLENIRNRVEAYNGKITFSSSPETGTEVNVDIQL
jgi:signal transduction histidine kinase